MVAKVQVCFRRKKDFANNILEKNNILIFQIFLPLFFSFWKSFYRMTLLDFLLMKKLRHFSGATIMAYHRVFVHLIIKVVNINLVRVTKLSYFCGVKF